MAASSVLDEQAFIWSAIVELRPNINNPQKFGIAILHVVWMAAPSQEEEGSGKLRIKTCSAESVKVALTKWV